MLIVFNPLLYIVIHFIDNGNIHETLMCLRKVDKDDWLTIYCLQQYQLGSLPTEFTLRSGERKDLGHYSMETFLQKFFGCSTYFLF